MLDFIFSTDRDAKDRNDFALKTCHTKHKPKTIHYVGDWGCLSVIGDAYPGFSPLEDHQHIVIILGGPLPRSNLHVADGSQSDDGTKWILSEWTKIRWQEDLIGHFAVLLVNKSDYVVQVVTDINSFVPIFESQGNKSQLIVSSHPDALAIASDKLATIDPISVGDFLKYRSVAFPYTFYQGVIQLSPASIHTIKNKKLSSIPYWSPDQEQFCGVFNDCADQLRELLTENIKRICHHQDSVGLLMSGGEDSRVIATIAAEQTCVKGFTFVQEINREARIASQVAKRIGIDWQPVFRKPYHYIINSESALLLASSINMIQHAHANGLVEHLPVNERILGGLMADAFFKCATHSARYYKTGKHIIKNNLDWSNRKVYISFPLSDDIDKAVEERRDNHNNWLSNIFPQTWLEWHWMNPSSQNSSMTNLQINRRLFPSYEPFMDARIFRFAISIPQHWKLNGQFYHQAMKPLFKETQFIFHSQGGLPYYKPIPVNLSIKIMTKIIWKLQGKFFKLLGRQMKDREPWPLSKDVVNNTVFDEMVGKLLESNFNNTHLCDQLSLEERVLDGLASEKFDVFQILIWSKWIEGIIA